MEAVKPRKSTAFRLDNDLLERLKAEAKRENRSLNNLVETILMDAVYYKPNPETLEAIEEVRSGKELETLDLEHFDEYVKSL
ncbi:toxin-antitoxin system protein [Bacteroides gallinaceum]|uniref:toxin-antitoxin system protein n=1 Tax=Bacteroides gallinaceum TaxID=1462571 RepID=UPI0025A4BDF7|nr:toxin-antitoxin system protein [Bacteroides gallinaceum]MDM8152868.1 toxin-antitoxin system protein [Bacteroides gallinaceum]